MSFENKKFEALPNGDYKVQLKKLTDRKTKKLNAAGVGNDMLTAQFQIIEGPEGVEGAKNRIVFENFLLTHDNSKPVEIALQKLTRYAEAIGMDIKDGVENNLDGLFRTVDKPFIATLGQKAPYNGKIDNTIKSYKAL